MSPGNQGVFSAPERNDSEKNFGILQLFLNDTFAELFAEQTNR